ASMASDAANNLTASMASDAAALALKNSELINNQINEEGSSLTISDSNQTALINSREPNLPTSLAPSANTSTPMSAPIPTYSITPSVSQSGWDAAINQRIVWMASQNIQSATLNINPEHLGPLQIQIQLDNNQQANVQFFSAQPEVRLALQNSIPMLSQMLEQTGIQLGQSDVSSQSSGSNPQQQKSNFNTLVNEQIKLDSTSTTVTSTTPINNGNGLLNIYA
ncbi:MAG: flagellar hook-length control protein FliK, partial [Methylococcales bacterium]